VGTKQTTDQSTKFDPQSMNRYQGWQNFMATGQGFGMPGLKSNSAPMGSAGNLGAAMQGWGGLQSFLSNPYGNPSYNLNVQNQTKGASALAGRGMSNALLNFNRTGMGGTMNSGVMQSLLGSLNRFGSGLQYQGFQNANQTAQNNMWNAASLGSSMFQPLQTGSKATQSTGGLGTWLPQLIGGGLGLATGMAGAGMFGGGGGGTNTGFGAGMLQGAGMSGTANPMSAWSPYNMQLTPPGGGGASFQPNGFLPGGLG
jgi:hypothetical protein